MSKNAAEVRSPDGAEPPKAAQRNPGKALPVVRGTPNYGAGALRGHIARCAIGPRSPPAPPSGLRSYGTMAVRDAVDSSSTDT
jgi:hypothetical protein